MPGKISRLQVTKGQAVKEGDPLLSIEAMKMETTVYSPRSGTVADVLVKAGSSVDTKDLVVVLTVS
jgi:pyruvate carboxylase